MLPTISGLTVIPVTDAEKQSRKIWQKRVARGYTQRRKTKQKRADGNRASIHAYDAWRVRAFMWLGGMCNSCKNNDMRVLQLDHTKGGGQAERQRVSYMKMLKRVFVAPGEFSLLCANCHAIKHANERKYNGY